MMGAAIHRSQRRVSCEACRKTKAKCQRIQPTDSQCARCFLMKIDCVAGEQKKVGRPRGKISTPATRRNEHSECLDEGTARVAARDKSDNSTYSPSALTQAHSRSQASFTPPKSSIVDFLDIPSPKADSWQQIVADVDALPTWDTSWELDMASLAATAHTSFYGGTYLSPQPTMALSSSWGSDVSSPRSLDTQHSSHLDSLSELQRVNFDLHIRAAAIEHHKKELNLEMMIYREGPLFIDGLTLTDLALKASQAFVETLSRLQGTQARAISPPTPPPALTFGDFSSATLSPRPRVANEPLSAPVVLAMTSVFTQLVELYELNVRQLSIRVEQIDTLPIAPIPGLAFAGETMLNPCIQGMLFCNMVVHLLERMERALGIAGSPENGEGLLSPRQMDVLWSELGGENGSTHVGMLRSKLLKKAYVDAGMMLREISLRVS
ncbi:Stemphyloxin II biosynthesis cluster transcription factor sthR [Paramyrothecium foliicola]|nr:Stemphyloxin II biosynthesis cluster transcription factor sthR [Paramyrothecium foliicola]